MPDAFLVPKPGRILPNIRANIFQQDPLVAAFNENVGITAISLPGEPQLGVGPTSSRVAVVDYNADLDEVFEPVQYLKDGTGFRVGRSDPEDDFKFHQVNVWAIVTKTLNLLEHERVFGRRIPWAFNGGRLMILPHAGYWQNAYYNRATGALHFFYFEGPDGHPVYTCLSHDIVTHELGHAVLDGLKPYYNEISTQATAGFHEFFGDAVAMTSSMSLRDIVVEVAGRGAGNLNEPNLIANSAAQFAAAVSPEVYGHLSECYLRTARNDVTMKDLEGVMEEHDYSEVLSGVYYDILAKSYTRLVPAAAKQLGKSKVDGQVRVKALFDAAAITGRLLLRAVDYSPPIDIDYLDYARAVLRADETVYPTDPLGFREIAQKAFLRRGIGGGAADLRPRRQLSNNDLRNLNIEVLSASRVDAYAFLDANRAVLGIPTTANFDVTSLYRTRKVSADGFRNPEEIILEFVWSVDVPLRGNRFGDLRGAVVPLWCGGTIVFNRDGNILYYVLKQETRARRRTMLDYVAYLVKQKQLGISDGESGLGRRGESNVVSARVVDGRVRMHRSAALRHSFGEFDRA